jgi:hypothetical protein
LKAERRKPSGEKHCDIEDIPSLTGVLAHFRLHEFSAIRGNIGGSIGGNKPGNQPEILGEILGRKTETRC